MRVTASSMEAPCSESQEEQAQESDIAAIEVRDTGPENRTQPPEEDIPSTARKRPMVNRIVYLGMMSFVSPLINFVLNWEDTKSMGITISLMLWLLFGVMWCAGFAMVMGPMFTFFALVVRLLDVIPAFGSSLWIVISTFVMVAVLRDSFPAFMHNLPLFSLAMANAIMLAFEAPRDFLRCGSPASFEGPSEITGYVSYGFQEGKLQCELCRKSEGQQLLFTIHAISTPDLAKDALESIVQNGYSYTEGRNLDMFKEMFNVWISQAKSVVQRVNGRRIFCLVGLLCESVAVVAVISLLGNIRGSSSSMFGSSRTAHSSNTPSETSEEGDHSNSAASEVPYFTSPLEFSLLQIVVCVTLLCFSDYLHMLINIHRSVSCKTEVRAFMLQCVSSRWFNWADSGHSYLENGRWLRGPKMHFDEEAIPVRELPLLGFIGDQEESKRSNATILTNAVHSKQIVIRRVGESLLHASLYNGEDGRQTLLDEDLENISIEIGDRIA